MCSIKHKLWLKLLAEFGWLQHFSLWTPHLSVPFGVWQLWLPCFHSVLSKVVPLRLQPGMSLVGINLWDQKIFIMRFSTGFICEKLAKRHSIFMCLLMFSALCTSCDLPSTLPSFPPSFFQGLLLEDGGRNKISAVKYLGPPWRE